MALFIGDSNSSLFSLSLKQPPSFPPLPLTRSNNYWQVLLSICKLIAYHCQRRTFQPLLQVIQKPEWISNPRQSKTQCLRNFCESAIKSICCSYILGNIHMTIVNFMTWRNQILIFYIICKIFFNSGILVRQNLMWTTSSPKL